MWDACSAPDPYMADSQVDWDRIYNSSPSVSLSVSWGDTEDSWIWGTSDFPTARTPVGQTCCTPRSLDWEEASSVDNCIIHEDDVPQYMRELVGTADCELYQDIYEYQQNVAVATGLAEQTTLHTLGKAAILPALPT